MKEQIRRWRNDPEELEHLYRAALDSGRAAEFAAALHACAAEAPDDLLMKAWACRLAAGGEEVEPAAALQPPQARRWGIAVALSIATGLLFVLMAGGGFPAPAPGEARPLFWIGWAPLTVLAIVGFIALAGGDRSRWRWYVGGAAAALLFALVGAAGSWGRTDDPALLTALHLPFLSWAALGAAVTLGRSDHPRQVYAYAVQSMEALVAGGIFFGSGMIFTGLTLGLLAVFGIQPGDELLRRLAAFGIGVIPVLAVATVCDPTRAPAQQPPTGLARVLRLMTWLLLPAALAVLALYVLWLVPAHFWQPFQERSVLIVYNATIIAVLALITATLSATDEAGGASAWLRRAVAALTGLTLLLNLYALAAIVSRIVEFGLTPNRHAVLGWNLVTAIVLGLVLAKLRSAPAEVWLASARTALARGMALPAAWALWLLCAVRLIG